MTLRHFNSDDQPDIGRIGNDADMSVCRSSLVAGEAPGFMNVSEMDRNCIAGNRLRQTPFDREQSLAGRPRYSRLREPLNMAESRPKGIDASVAVGDDR